MNNLSLIINVFFKVTVFFYAAVIGSAELFHVQKKWLVIPVGVIILVTSILIAGNTIENSQQGKLVLRYIFIPFAAIIPFLLILVHLIRKRFKSN